MGTLLLPPWPSFNPGAIGDSNSAPVPPIEALTIVAVDTGISGYNFIEVSVPPTMVLLGDRIAQGASQGFVQGILGTLIFLDTVAGFSPGSAYAYDDTGGTPIDWEVFPPQNITTCRLLFSADVGVTTAGSAVTTWANQGSTGSLQDVTQGTAANRPTLVAADAQFNGYNSISFDGDDHLAGTGFAAGATLEAFVVARMNADPAASGATSGFLGLGTPTHLQNYPWSSDGVIYDGMLCGSTNFRNTGNPTTSLATTHCYNVVSTASEWTSFINGSQHFTTGTNTAGFATSLQNFLIGASPPAAILYNCAGKIALVTLFGTKLSNNYKLIMKTHISAKYNITLV